MRRAGGPRAVDAVHVERRRRAFRRPEAAGSAATGAAMLVGVVFEIVSCDDATGIWTNWPCRFAFELDQDLEVDESRRVVGRNGPVPTRAAARSRRRLRVVRQLDVRLVRDRDVEVLDVLGCEDLVRLAVDRVGAEDDAVPGAKCCSSRRSVVTVWAAMKSLLHLRRRERGLAVGGRCGRPGARLRRRERPPASRELVHDSSFAFREPIT